MFLRKYMTKSSESSDVFNRNMQMSKSTEVLSPNDEENAAGSNERTRERLFIKWRCNPVTAGPSCRKIRQKEKSKLAGGILRNSDNISQGRNDVTSMTIPRTNTNIHKDGAETVETLTLEIREKTSDNLVPKAKKTDDVVCVERVLIKMKDDYSDTEVRSLENNTNLMENKVVSSKNQNIQETNTNTNIIANTNTLENILEKPYESLEALSKWGQILLLKVAYDKIPVEHIEKTNVLHIVSHREDILRELDPKSKIFSNTSEEDAETTSSKLSHSGETLSTERLSYLNDIVESCVFLTDVLQEIGNTAPLVASALKLAAFEFSTVSELAFPLAVIAYKHAAFAIALMRYLALFVRLTTDPPFSNVAFQKIIEPIWNAISTILTVCRILVENISKIEQNIVAALSNSGFRAAENVENSDKSYVIFHIESARNLLKTIMLNLATANRELSKGFHNFQTQGEYERYIEEMKSSVGDFEDLDSCVEYQYRSSKRDKPRRDRSSSRERLSRFFRRFGELMRYIRKRRFNHLLHDLLMK